MRHTGKPQMQDLLLKLRGVNDFVKCKVELRAALRDYAVSRTTLYYLTMSLPPLEQMPKRTIRIISKERLVPVNLRKHVFLHPSGRLTMA